MSRPPSMLSFTLLAFALTILLSAYLYLRPSPQTYVSANHRALAALPVYPGSRPAAETTSAVYDGDNALARVVERLRGHCRVQEVLDGPVANFTCGTASVSVDAGGPLFTRRYEITVDSR